MSWEKVGSVAVRSVVVGSVVVVSVAVIVLIKGDEGVLLTTACTSIRWQSPLLNWAIKIMIN